MQKFAAAGGSPGSLRVRRQPILRVDYAPQSPRRGLAASSPVPVDRGETTGAEPVGRCQVPVALDHRGIPALFDMTGSAAANLRSHSAWNARWMRSTWGPAIRAASAAIFGRRSANASAKTPYRFAVRTGLARTANRRSFAGVGFSMNAAPAISNSGRMFSAAICRARCSQWSHCLWRSRMRTRNRRHAGAGPEEIALVLTVRTGLRFEPACACRSLRHGRRAPFSEEFSESIELPPVGCEDWVLRRVAITDCTDEIILRHQSLP